MVKNKNHSKFKIKIKNTFVVREGVVMKINENHNERVIWKLPKATLFGWYLCNIFRENIMTYALYYLSLSSFNLLWKQWSFVTSIWLISKKNKWKCECVRKMAFYEIFDFQCTFLIKLTYRYLLKFLQTFIMVKDDITLCQCYIGQRQQLEV